MSMKSSRSTNVSLSCACDVKPKGLPRRTSLAPIQQSMPRMHSSSQGSGQLGIHRDVNVAALDGFGCPSSRRRTRCARSSAPGCRRAARRRASPETRRRATSHTSAGDEAHTCTANARAMSVRGTPSAIISSACARRTIRCSAWAGRIAAAIDASHFRGQCLCPARRRPPSAALAPVERYAAPPGQAASQQRLMPRTSNSFERLRRSGSLEQKHQTGNAVAEGAIGAASPCASAFIVWNAAARGPAVSPT